MLGLCLLLAAAPAEVVAVAPLDGLGVEPALVESLSAAVRKKVADLGHDVVEVGGCAGDLACLVAEGQKVGATTIVAGSVGLVQDEVHIVLKRVDVASGTETSSETARAPVDQAEGKVRATALKLLDPQRYNTSGAIIVRVNVTGAEVIVDGASRGRTPLLGPIDSLPPGRREVEIRAPGAAAPWRGFVDTPVEGVSQVEISLVDGKLVEGEPPDESGTPDGPGVSPMLIGGGAAAVVGAVALVAGGLFYADAWSTYEQIVYGGNTDAVLKNRNSASTLAAGILLPLGVLGLAGGGTLIALDLME